MDLENLRQQTDALRIEIGKMVLGQDEIVELLLVSLYARGHVLLEGPPGTAKTLLAKSFSSALALEFGRIQFTPDLMPGDVLGASIFDFKSNSFILTKGPVFSQILLADEINRAPPKTQAALLQAMNERVVSIDGTDHELGREFMVIATQNPIEQQGTYPLPEAQLDRFLFKLILDFPPEDIEMAILQNHAGRPLNVGLSTDGIAKVMTSSDLMSIRNLIDKIILKDDILAYILRLVRATRESSEIAYGASTRAADALVGATRAIAAINGRDYAIPDDVKKLFIPAMRHRILLLPVAEIEGRSPEQALENIINQIEAPR
ncbi:AAA family ATPase [Cohaesibacter gelatinilyticus]|uniref:MoxR-like ATPase n=1 Tax=Cohaesibacter gelatinilyticus TaxID=372072 RepID=A0A285NAU5_9HYPH|nr:MoxR family ATPase [Cohaesibacter gelatinilyticus]SNZ06614.1 MoxR-like ATPase [Cohaesibacter gelatinilyticus]